MGDRLKIIYKPISEIKEYSNNPRRNDDAVKYLVNSVREFGIRTPVLIDQNDILVAGHTRLKAYYELGITEVPCLIIDDLTEEQIRAYRLADNKTAEMSGWDFAKLDKELEDILSIDMSDFGFKDLDASEMFNVDDFFADSDGTSAGSKTPKTVTCPHCGEEFEI